MMVGTAQGRKRTARMRVWPRNFSLRSSAMHMPNTSFTANGGPV